MAADLGLTSWYSSLGAAIQSAFGSAFVPIQTGSQGDFAYFYQNQNLQFNQWTYNYVSPVVRAGEYPGSAKLSSSGSFPLSYLQLVNQIVFRLSAADSQALTTAQNNTVLQAGNVVSTWSSVFGRITPAEIQKAAAVLGYTPQLVDYVVSYQLGSVWSGAAPPITYSQMLKAPELRSLLPKMPSNGATVVAAVNEYIAAANQAVPIMDQMNFANWLIYRIKTVLLAQNLMNGSAAMETFDTQSGAASQWVPAYGIGKSTQQIVTQLNGSTTVTMSIQVAQTGASEYRVSINGGAPFTTGDPVLVSASPGSGAA